MELRVLGSSGVKVSPICLGTMLFGDQTNEKTAAAIVAMARDAGVNFIDTADVYVSGTSEKITGKLIAKQRDKWVLATKVGGPFGGGVDPNQRGLSRRWITHQLEQSLRRLRTDYIDIYYFHREDHETAFEESLRAVEDAIRAGKIRYFGLSNFRAWRHSEVVWLCKELGMDKPVVSQPYYNALNRMPEVEVLPVCAHHGLGVVPYSPIARGVLTGKYKSGRKPLRGSRAARNDKRIMQTEYRQESFTISETVVEHANARGMDPVHFAMHWVLANPVVTSVIAGPRTVAQMKIYLGAFEHEWKPEDEALIDNLVSPGHPSTPGFLDPAYPIEGRPTNR
ncbi:MAG: L-glyceraldehyde 3-phosphate reductase [Alphaproteobacteria bacterium MarineAlpha9_Bin5]|jgi:aryl-alcohol dehydrogenase-like predicted oxidoreductase|nr:MAG: L-glyceraldehyde 3-phosphate reductase [Alphaproteobacteria bacterium MarineAlpha9_Bin5]HHZ68628.1 aldo/keto reductase [Alphaproteobacteria bacterium]HIA22175.1 aldo/keto reductase [Alphaproteobacteria bacterium]HIB19820.1 aldo/keto reductase [Alphaproteobacteria bacterium]HIB55661.1 aldo/keto reductase [Alphaproteobacteria bacterium]